MQGGAHFSMRVFWGRNVRSNATIPRQNGSLKSDEFEKDIGNATFRRFEGVTGGKGGIWVDEKRNGF